MCFGVTTLVSEYLLFFFPSFTLPPLNAMLKVKTGLSIPVIVKIFLGIFILWAALGVGELFGKINMMMMDL